MEIALHEYLTSQKILTFFKDKKKLNREKIKKISQRQSPLEISGLIDKFYRDRFSKFGAPILKGVGDDINFGSLQLKFYSLYLTCIVVSEGGIEGYQGLIEAAFHKIDSVFKVKELLLNKYGLSNQKIGIENDQEQEGEDSTNSSTSNKGKGKIDGRHKVESGAKIVEEEEGGQHQNQGVKGKEKEKLLFSMMLTFKEMNYSSSQRTVCLSDISQLLLAYFYATFSLDNLEVYLKIVRDFRHVVRKMGPSNEPLAAILQTVLKPIAYLARTYTAMK